MNIKELISKASEDTLSEKDILKFSEEQEMSLDEFAHLFARVIAENYNSGEFNYTYSDDAMNWLYDFMTDPAYLKSNSNYISGFPLGVYLAFDAGEYHHQQDDKSIDPVNKYTDPAIRELLGLA